MCLHPKIVRRAEVGEQDLSTTPNQQVAGLDILVNEAVLVDVVERCSRLLNIRHKLFSICKSPTAIFSAKEVVESFRRVLHHEIGASICNLAEVIDG